MEENKNTVNQENQNQEAAQEVKPETKETVSVELNPKVAKAMQVTGKVLKIAIPFAIGAVGVALGYNVGTSKERKKSSAAAVDYNAQIAELQLKLEQKPDVVPVDVPSVELPETIISEF